ncbi:MAG: phage virion morphogenesis protein [Bacteroidales bacterium]|nr:phage virion morphogenesis protein [Bacteroidales bacterium]
MTIEELKSGLERKIEEAKAYLEGGEVRDLVGTEAVEHFRRSFEEEGFTDAKLNPWQDVKRRDPDSPWYGHSGQTGKFSEARTTAKILTGETGHLRASFKYVPTANGVRVQNTAPYAAVHQYGLPAKVYGKKPFTMPRRPFMGDSQALRKLLTDAIINTVTKIIRIK